MKFILATLACLLWATALKAETLTLKGTVTDRENGTPLVGATVLDIAAKKGCTTDSRGEFTLTTERAASYRLTAGYTGYAPDTLTTDGRLPIRFRLQQNNWLPNLTVYGLSQDFGVNSSQMSAVELPVSEIRSIPAFLGEPDVLKALQKLPGVTTANDGSSGIYVRGGNIDQNMVTLDGSTLFNPVHLKGFASAINSDMVDNVLFYKGGFPAHIGSRLSGVVDVGIKEGDFNRYHGRVSLGMLTSRVQLEGPIWKNRTSFNIGARMSFFDWIMLPLMEKVYLFPDAHTYANMDYYDITAKVVHKFSDTDKLTAAFFIGNDVCDDAPQENEYKADKQISYSGSSTDNGWKNIASNLFWTHQKNQSLQINTNLGYSRYIYKLKSSNWSELKYFQDENYKIVDTKNAYHTLFWQENRSTIDELSVSSDLKLLFGDNHVVRTGAELTAQQFGPIAESYQEIYGIQDGVETLNINGNQYGTTQGTLSAALYAEDDWTFHPQWKANLGLRYSLVAVGKIYQLLEPRLSVRWLPRKDMALKASYSRTSQSIHRLSTSSIIMASDLWVPVTENIPMMKSDQWALGYNYEFLGDLSLSAEGYYKTMDNIIEYRNGASYLLQGSDWEKQVAVGAGRAYGVELMLQKQSERTNGWISYTWSKALNKFDRPGNIIENGREYYAPHDRRHNFNIFISHQFKTGWKVSASWSYQTGRLGTLPDICAPEAYVTGISPSGAPIVIGGHWEEIATSYPWQSGSSEVETFHYSWRTYASKRNNYRLPANHHLDISVSYLFKHKWGESDFNVTLYNVYNQMNVTNTYLEHENRMTTLTGVCLFPFIPSFSYSLKF